MQFFDSLLQMMVRFRYPVSMPEDIAEALGISLKNTIAFESLLLACQTCSPTRLVKFMPRMEAESVFHAAQRKDRFTQSSLYSFYFNEGWLEFELQFDHTSLLRRLYIHHRLIADPHCLELHLIHDPQRSESPIPESRDSLFIA